MSILLSPYMYAAVETDVRKFRVYGLATVFNFTNPTPETREIK